MLQEQLEEIIGYTDSDLYSEAVDNFNEMGVLSAEALPFMNAVFEKAPGALVKRLKEAGFRGEVTLIRSCGEDNTPVYILFDPSRYTEEEAVARLTSLS